MFHRPSHGGPLVSVVLTTRDRPTFVRLALQCHARQRYANRELIVVDDGERFPIDDGAVRAAGGRCIRVAPGTPLGTKMNLGLEVARGALCTKMDDDDWYGPRYLRAGVDAVATQWAAGGEPVLAFHRGYVFFDLRGWRLWRTSAHFISGATLMFPREQWVQRPFRPVRSQVDVWFLSDQLDLGARPCGVADTGQFLQVRHTGRSDERAHLWERQRDGQALDDSLQDMVPAGLPEERLPRWALAVYRRLHAEVR